MVVQISTGLTADVEEEVAQDQGLVDAEDAQGRDQVLEAEVAGDVARHRSPDPAAAHHATAREAEADQQHATARGVEAVTTRNRGLAPLPVTAGADQSPEAETRRKRRKNQGASLGRRRTRAGTSRGQGMDRPHLGRSLVPDLRWIDLLSGKVSFSGEVSFPILGSVAARPLFFFVQWTAVHHQNRITDYAPPLKKSN